VQAQVSPLELPRHVQDRARCKFIGLRHYARHDTGVIILSDIATLCLHVTPEHCGSQRRDNAIRS